LILDMFLEIFLVCAVHFNFDDQIEITV